MALAFVTTNAGKFAEATHILSCPIRQVMIELEEIQGSSEEIVSHKAHDALKQLNCPLFVEDVALHCSAIGNLPGPYIKDFLKALGEEGLANLIHRYDDHLAVATCFAAYIEPGEQPLIFSGKLEGQIVSPRGNTKHGRLSWNALFQPLGYSQTFGQLSIAEISRLSPRSQALKALDQFLIANPHSS